MSATQPCAYDFDYEDASGYLATAAALKSIGVTAHLDMSRYISNGAHLKAAGSHFVVEDGHVTYLRLDQSPSQSPAPSLPSLPSSSDVPLDFDELHSLASRFISRCPASNIGLLELSVTGHALGAAREQWTMKCQAGGKGGGNFPRSWVNDIGWWLKM